MTLETSKDKSLDWLAANVTPIQKGEVLPQLMAVPGFEKNARILFTDRDASDFASSIETTHLKDGPARFIASPDKAAAGNLSPQEYLAVLYVADGEKILTALGQATDYKDAAILRIFRNGWAKFIAIPIKILDELKKAARSLRITQIAA